MPIEVAKKFIKEIVRLHGVPISIVSNHDPKHTLNFWKALLTSLGMQLKFGMAYRPQTDGQTKRTNQIIEDILHSYYSKEPRSWMKFLPLVEFAYNLAY